jgi:glycosyltransferase involved in cell wall biosynthesis
MPVDAPSTLPRAPHADARPPVDTRVSVVIPAYNSARTLARALSSIRRQTLWPGEVLIVDDCSTDDTPRIVAEYADIGARLIQLTQRGGASNARNVGVRAAKGDFVAFLDADDEWLARKLEKQIAVIAANPRMSFVSCRAKLLGTSGYIIGSIHDGVPVETGAEAWRTLLASNFIATPCVLTRRDMLLALGGFDTSLPIAEDQDMWIRLATAGDVGFVEEFLVFVHDSPKSLSKEHATREIEITLPMVLRHIERLRPRLDQRALRHILGARYTKIGRNAYQNQRLVPGLLLVTKAILLGSNGFENIMFLASASPVARFAKRQIGRFASWIESPTGAGHTQR